MAEVDQMLFNRLKGALPTIARLAADEDLVLGQFEELFDLPGASVIEIGGRLSPARVEMSGVSRWYSVDPRNAALPDEGPVVTACVPASNFNHPEDGSVDLVFSCNAFQHIHDFAETLERIARFVRPGGHLYANFGPIWSGPDGSHIENVTCQGRVYNFWDHSLLPSWAHLVYDEDELVEILTPIHGETLAVALADYVHHSSWINRLFFEDYVQIIEASVWQPVFIGGSECFGYAYHPPQVNHRLRNRLENVRLAAEVRERHGNNKHSLLVRDVELVLKR